MSRLGSSTSRSEVVAGAILLQAGAEQFDAQVPSWLRIRELERRVGELERVDTSTAAGP